MDQTIEGIGGRKWSFEFEGDGALMYLNQGAHRLARIEPNGVAVKFLLVTAPQLWEAANDVLLAEQAFLAKDTNANSDRCSIAVTKLGEMVAKAVGKQDWKDVLQG